MELENGTILDPTLFAAFKDLVLAQVQTGYLFGVATNEPFPAMVVVLENSA